ncbi:hypothetical protein HD554DRAFT_2019714, partial [Boletus coccyginus]
MNAQPSQLPAQRSSICIWQQNLNKSNTTQQRFLSNLNPNIYDVATIQEPTINYVNLTVTNPRWNTIYPTVHETKDATHMRSVILVNKNLSKDSWRTIPIKSLDITAIELTGDWGKVHIYNVYND